MDEPTWRKPVGMLAILTLLTVWAVAVVTAVDALGAPVAVQGLLYLVGGVLWLWLLPMRRLLRWMELGRWRN